MDVKEIKGAVKFKKKCTYKSRIYDIKACRLFLDSAGELSYAMELYDEKANSVIYAKLSEVIL